MAYLGNIIKKIEGELDVRIYGHYHSRAEIESVLFGAETEPPASTISRKILFIYNQEYTGPFPDGYCLLLHCNEQNLPANCLTIHKEVPIHTVFNLAQTVLLEHHLLKSKEEELFQCLQTSNGIAGLTHMAYAHLGNPVNICDTSFSILASSPKLNSDGDLEESNGRLYLKESKFQDMLDKELITKIYSSTVPFVTYLEDYPYAWIFRSIRIEHSVVGYICVRAIEREVTEEDLEYIDMFSHIVSIEMQKNISPRDTAEVNYEFFLTELLEGHFDQESHIINHMLQLGHQPAHTYYMIILDGSSKEPLELSLKNIYTQILSILPNCMVIYFREKITILQPADSYEPFTEKEKKKFLTFLQFHKLFAYISYPYGEIRESPQYYRQPRFLSSLSMREKTQTDSRLIFYKDFFLEHSFQLSRNLALLKTTLHPDILHILAYDKKYHTEYAHTLEVYLLNNRNAVSTSKELHIHKSTFFYRLNKITELFQIDFHKEGLFFAYEYSFRLLHYLKR